MSNDNEFMMFLTKEDGTLSDDLVRGDETIREVLMKQGVPKEQLQRGDISAQVDGVIHDLEARIREVAGSKTLNLQIAIKADLG